MLKPQKAPSLLGSITDYWYHTIYNSEGSSRAAEKSWYASSYTKPKVILACSSMWSNDRYLIRSSVPWMCWSEFSNADSITKAEGYPALEAEAWSEQA